MIDGMNWPIFSLGNVCSVRRGTTITQNQAKPGVIPVVAGGLAPTYFHDTPNRGCNVITVSASGANAGFVNYWENPIFASDCSTVESESPDVSIKYIFHFLRGKQEYIYSKLRSGAAQPHVYAKDIAALEIPLPPLHEQCRIAAILDQTDALRAKRREALAQLDSLTQSIFIEMFGDPKALINGGQCKELADVVAPGRIVTYGIVQAGPEVENGVPYVRTGDIKNGEILEHQLARTSYEIASSYSRSAISAGDIVMSIRATVGTTALVTESLEGGNLTQGTARISPGPEVRCEYLLNYLRTDTVQAWIQSQVKGATFREITLGKLRQLPVFVPSLELQARFAEQIDTVNSLKVVNRQSLAELDTLFASLQHRAFRGEL
jgi:type I restriction enzyme S subunit